MAEAATRLPVKTETPAPAPARDMREWRPFETLHREIDRLFDDIGGEFWRAPFRRHTFDLEPLWRRAANVAMPAVDIAEKEAAYEITADLPGMDEKNVEVQLLNGNLIIKGEKHEEREEKKKDFHLHERRAGSFERTFGVPDGVDTDKIEADFKKGVLTIRLPKKPEAQKPTKKIAIKAA